jgi:hypothetical protein
MPTTKKGSTPPTTALQAYKALQKSLQLKDTNEDEGLTGAGPEVVDFLGASKGALLRSAVEFAFSELAALPRVELISRVLGKHYFAFQNGALLSRPINQDLFSDALNPVRDVCRLLERAFIGPGELSAELGKWPANLLQVTLYSMAIAFCSAIDVQKTGDRKTPGTFFEYLIAYLFSHRLHVNPRRRVEVRSAGHSISIPTDFIFDPGAGKRKFHVPVKTSTRERVIQVWSHQRVIDGTLGHGRYLGTPVILTETKLDKKTLEVVEICLPEQWQIYQGHIAQLKRVYYLDIPEPYANLNRAMPPIEVRPFVDFFYEADALASA